MQLTRDSRNDEAGRDPGHFRMAGRREGASRLDDRGGCSQAGPNRSGRFPFIPALFFTIDAGLDAVCLNPAVKDILGYSPREAASETGWFLRRVHPEDRDAIRAALVAALAEESAFVAECRLLSKSGGAVHGLLQAFPARDGAPGGQAPRLEAMFVDISERVRLETLLVQSEKLKTLGAISAEIVHEIRNPLMAVAGFARRLLKKHPDAPEVEIILSEAGRLERLLARITDYIKPVRFNMAPCSFKALLADGLGLLFPEMEEKGVWCELSLDPDAPPVMADPEILGQACINLLRNALQGLGDSTVIHARAGRTSSEAFLEIRYLPREDAVFDPETMFLPFDEGGHDVGLPLCARMLRGMGGSLSFAEELGEAVFTAAMPLNGDGARRDAPRPRPDGTARRAFGDETLLSRRAFEDLFKRMARSSARRGDHFSLLLVEPSGGPRDEAGDEAGLAPLAAALAPLLPATRAAGRFGSGEMGVLLPGAGRQEAEKTARTIRAALARTLPEGFPEIILGAASCAPGTRASLPDILETAKRALFLDKKSTDGAPRVLMVPGPDRYA